MKIHLIPKITILNLLVSLLHYCILWLRFRYVVSADRTFGTKLPDGSWTGLLGMVVREVSDQ